MNEQTSLRLAVLMRHAEAKGSAPGGDVARELTKHGRRAARHVAAWLIDQGVRPDLVVSSPAARTTQTWLELAEAGVEAVALRSEDAVYDADPEDLVEVLAGAPDSARTVLLIGHAPGVPALAATLPDHTGMDESGRAQLRRWPPGAVAVVSHAGPWPEFPSADSALVAFHAP